MDVPSDNRGSDPGGGDPGGFVVPHDTGAPADWIAPETVAGGTATPLVRTELGGTELRAQVAALAVETTGEAPRPPVPLVPLTSSDVLDGAWALIKARPRTVYGLTALLVLPVDLVAFFVMRGDQKVFSVWWQLLSTTVPLGSSTTSYTVPTSVIAAALLTLPAWFLGAGFTQLVTAWYGGQDLTLRQVLAGVGRRSGAVLGAMALTWVLAALAALLCFLAGVPSLFVATLCAVVVPVVVAEQAGPVRALSRSVALVRRRLGACLWIIVLAAVVELVVYLALMLLPAVASAFTPTAVTDVLVPLGTLLAQLVTAPFAPAVAVILYLDLRVRTEGIDLDRDAATAFADAP